MLHRKELLQLWQWKAKAKLRSKGNGKGPVKQEKQDIESEDEMPRHMYVPKQWPAKHIKSSAYVEESDEMLVLGFETSQQPPPSCSLSPKPCQEAAKGAQHGIAATVKFVNHEEHVAKKCANRNNKGSYSYYIY